MSRILIGQVTSDKPNKTIIVRVDMRKTHPIYRKQYTRNRKFMAHDEKNEAKIGDMVAIRESRPLSASKRFMLDKILERAGTRFEESDAEADIPKEELEKQKPAPQPKAKSDNKPSVDNVPANEEKP